MKSYFNMIVYSIREEIAKKTIVILFGFLIVSILLFALYVNSYANLDLSKLSGDEISNTILQFQSFVVNGFFGIMFLIAIYVSSGYIFTIVDKGYIDILLSKPINRNSLFLAKYSVGVIIILTAAAFITFSVWLITALKFNCFAADVFLQIPKIVFAFMLLYAFLSFFTILTRISFPGILASYFVYMIGSALLVLLKEGKLVTNGIISAIAGVLYHLVPKTFEILNSTQAKNGLSLSGNSMEVYYTSAIYLVFLLAVNSYMYSKKDL